MELPKAKIKAQSLDPKFMILFARPKTGKSTFCAALDNNLVLDLEDGYTALEAAKIVMTNNSTCIDEIKEVVRELHKEKVATGKKPYRFITIDNATRLEERVNKYAIQLYQDTPVGKNWGWLKDDKGVFVKDAQGNNVIDPKADIKSLAMGAGYAYIKQAIINVLNWLQPYCDTLILVCHTKDKNIQYNGVEMNEMSVDLLGKTADVLCGMSDAVGYMYRSVEGKTILSFKAGDNVIRGARNPKLSNKEFEVIQLNEAGDGVVVNTKCIFD